MSIIKTFSIAKLSNIIHLALALYNPVYEVWQKFRYCLGVVDQRTKIIKNGLV